MFLFIYFLPFFLFFLDAFFNLACILNVNVSSKQLLVLSEIFYPEGWIITSHPDWEIHCVNHLLRGIYIPPGTHEIILEFIPDDIYYGKPITISSTILIIILIILGLYKEKRPFAS